MGRKIKVSETEQGRQKRHEKAKVDFNKRGNLQDKIDVIAELLGLKEADEKEKS